MLGLDLKSGWFVAVLVYSRNVWIFLSDRFVLFCLCAFEDLNFHDLFGSFWFSSILFAEWDFVCCCFSQVWSVLYLIFYCLICSYRFGIIPFSFKCLDLAIQICWFDYVVSVFSFKLVWNISTFLHFSHFPDL